MKKTGRQACGVAPAGPRASDNPRRRAALPEVAASGTAAGGHNPEYCTNITARTERTQI